MENLLSKHLKIYHHHLGILKTHKSNFEHTPENVTPVLMHVSAILRCHYFVEPLTGNENVLMAT